MNIKQLDGIQDKYKIVKELGSGGFSNVFHAVQSTTGQDVALKVMSSLMSDTEEDLARKAARFRREMKLCGELFHPNIVCVLDSGELENGLIYTVFEYVPGQSLSELLKKEGALRIAAARDLMLQVLDALTAAHKTGIVHRDLKPDNIMINRTGAVEQSKILDFGISTFTSAYKANYTRLTMTREFLGTPAYSAPEQLRGEPVTVKSDLYAWGLIFLECLTGKPAIDGPSIGHIVQKQLSPNPVPIPSVLKGHGLGALLGWTLQKNFKRRAGDALHVLTRFRKTSIGDIPNINGYLGEDASPGEARARAPKGRASMAKKSERRQITSICCSVNIDAIPESISPEALDEIHHDLFLTCMEKAGQFGGHLLGELADRFMVLFGYPNARDTDARFAARTVLELSALGARRNAILQSRYGARFTFRAGVHTGFVTVRKSSESGDRLVGVAPGMAGALCDIAPSGEIVVSEESRALLEKYLECDLFSPDPTHPFFSRTHRVLGERRAGDLALSVASGASLAGRREELETLVDAWRTARKKRGRAWLIQGEAGIGKSRLAGEFALSAERAGGTWLECRCAPEERNAALYPVIRFLREHLKLGNANDHAGAFHTLEQLFEKHGMDPERAMPLFCPWFGLPLDAYAPLSVSPQRGRELFLKDLNTLMIRIASASSAVLVIEDLHWADPTTLELLSRLIEEIKNHNLFLLMTARPSFSNQWKRKDVGVLELEGLTGEEIKNILIEKAPNQRISDSLIERMVEEADGVPLFAEELAGILLEKKARGNRKIVSDQETIRVDIPNTLRDLLTSRLDRTGPARETAQLAAVIGRGFDYNLIARVSARDEASLLADLDQLASAGLIHIHHRVGNIEYVFHHALVRETAYDGMPGAVRRRMHAEIAAALEDHFPVIIGERPAEAARHHAGAGAFEKAVDYGARAAKIAMERFLNDETILYCHQVLEWVDRMPREKRFDAELEINGFLTQALMTKHGWADQRVKARVNRSRELLSRMEKTGRIVPALWSLAVYHHVASNREEVRALTDELLHLSEQLDDQGLRAAAATLLGLRYKTDGQYVESIEAFERALKLYDPETHGSHGMIFGLDTRAWAAASLALAHWFSGFGRSAAEHGESAISRAREVNHIPSLGIALLYRALCHYHAGDRKAAADVISELLDIAGKFGLPAYIGYGAVIRCWAEGDAEPVEGILDGLERMGCKLGLTIYREMLADIQAENGFIDEAIRQVDICLRLCVENDEHVNEPVLLRRRALYLLKKHPTGAPGIRASLSEAAALARRQGMFRTEAEALFDLFRLKALDRAQEERLGKTLSLRPEIPTPDDFIPSRP